MSHNPIIEPFDPQAVNVLIHAADPRVRALLKRTVEAAGCRRVEATGDADAAIALIDSFLPRTVLIAVDVENPAQLRDAQRINKKRVRTDRRTPKILGLVNPSAEDLARAKAAGFYDVLALPVTPTVLRARLETVTQRFD